MESRKTVLMNLLQGSFGDVDIENRLMGFYFKCKKGYYTIGIFKIFYVIDVLLPQGIQAYRPRCFLKCILLKK